MYVIMFVCSPEQSSSWDSFLNHIYQAHVVSEAGLKLSCQLINNVDCVQSKCGEADVCTWHLSKVCPRLQVLPSGQPGVLMAHSPQTLSEMQLPEEVVSSLAEIRCTGLPVAVCLSVGHQLMSNDALWPDSG
jgi:hypothetical protein